MIEEQSSITVSYLESFVQSSITFCVYAGGEYRNIVWLALIGSELVIVHIFLFLVSKFGKRSTEKQKNYGALVLPSFEIFLLILALPCLWQASATILKGNSNYTFLGIEFSVANATAN